MNKSVRNGKVIKNLKIWLEQYPTSKFYHDIKNVYNDEYFDRFIDSFIAHSEANWELFLKA